MKNLDYRHIALLIFSVVLAGLSALYPQFAPVLKVLAPILVTCGIALPQPQGAPPAGPLAMVLAAGLVVAHASACTPVQQKDASALVVEAVQCLAQQTSVQPTPPPEQIAITCGLSSAPDIIQLIKDLVAQKAAARAALDAGK